MKKIATLVFVLLLDINITLGQNVQNSNTANEKNKIWTKEHKDELYNELFEMMLAERYVKPDAEKIANCMLGKLTVKFSPHSLDSMSEKDDFFDLLMEVSNECSYGYLKKEHEWSQEFKDSRNKFVKETIISKGYSEKTATWLTGCVVSKMQREFSERKFLEMDYDKRSAWENKTIEECNRQLLNVEKWSNEAKAALVKEYNQNFIKAGFSEKTAESISNCFVSRITENYLPEDMKNKTDKKFMEWVSIVTEQCVRQHLGKTD